MTMLRDNPYISRVDLELMLGFMKLQNLIDSVGGMVNTSGYVDVDDSCKFFDSQVKKYTLP